MSSTSSSSSPLQPLAPKLSQTFTGDYDDRGPDMTAATPEEFILARDGKVVYLLGWDDTLDQMNRPVREFSFEIEDSSRNITFSLYSDNSWHSIEF